MRVSWDTTQSSTSLPLLLFQFRAPRSLSFFSSIKASSSSFLSKAHSWWWSSFFHDLFPSGWRLVSPLLLYLLLCLHGGKSPSKDLIEAQRSSLHRSFTSKLSSCSITRLVGVVEDVLIKVHQLIFLVDFVIMDIEENAEIPLILGWPFIVFSGQGQLFSLHSLLCSSLPLFTQFAGYSVIPMPCSENLVIWVIVPSICL